MSAVELDVAAAIAEIAGCSAYSELLRHGKSALWLILGTLSLMIFAWVLALSPMTLAGRADAAFGGIWYCHENRVLAALNLRTTYWVALRRRLQRAVLRIADGQNVPH